MTCQNTILNQRLVLVVILLLNIFSVRSQSQADYYGVLIKEGKEPKSFILNKLELHDLIIFDDALHSAVEPFDFYIDYLINHPNTVDYLFLEVMQISVQKHIDSYLNNPTKDTSLLTKVFQESYTYGWRYESYLELFSTVWDINQTLPEEDKIKIIGVDQPIYWEGLHTTADYKVFKESLISRDNFMYNTIIKYMDGFNSGKKGIFLTNTRHAYKCIKKSNGQIYWNAGTFFNQWHKGKTYAVRFHNMILNIEKESKEESSTMQGLDRYEYSWVRMGNGLWDKTFAQNEDKPIAISLSNNIFGQHKYLGNHMINVKEGQTMFDAYDAIIFLKPLEETKFSAQTNFYFTETFKKELEHRVMVMEGDDLDGFLMKNKVNTIAEFIDELAEYIPEKANPLVN